MNQKVFQPTRTRKAAMNQQAMQSDRMPQTERADGEEARKQGGIPMQGERAANQGDQGMRTKPERLHWTPINLALAGIGPRVAIGHPCHFVDLHDRSSLFIRSIKDRLWA